MKTLSRVAVAATIALALGAGSAVPAFADTDGPSRAEALSLNEEYGDLSAAELNALPEEELSKIEEAAEVATFDETTTVTYDAAATAIAAKSTSMKSTTATTPVILCYTSRAQRTAKSVVGINLYMSYTVGGWCRSGSKVVSASLKDSGSQTYYLGWSSNGKIGSGSGVVSGQGRSYAQYKFTFHLGTPVPTQYPTPCVRVKGLGNASAQSDYTCGIY